MTPTNRRSGWLSRHMLFCNGASLAVLALNLEHQAYLRAREEIEKAKRLGKAMAANQAEMTNGL